MPYTFTGELVALAKANKSEHLTRSIKSGSERTLNEALESVDKIADTAIEFARGQKRSQVDSSDFSKALEANFCRIWPFCK